MGCKIRDPVTNPVAACLTPCNVPAMLFETPAATNTHDDPAPESESKLEAEKEVTRLVRQALELPLAQRCAAHLMSLYGGQSWPILRDATMALLRRFESAQSESLRVAARQLFGRSQVCGHYVIHRGRRDKRPYQTIVAQLAPLHVACSCPDYRMGSLGLCKHGACALTWLAKRKLLDTPTPTHALRNNRSVSIDWDPVRPLDGAGDWLSGIEIYARASQLIPETIRPWLADDREMPMRVKASALEDTMQRSQVVTALAQWVATQRRPHPALAAWLAHEQRQRDRREKCTIPSASLDSALATFQLKLYPYQRQSAQRFLQEGRLLLADDMGLGKTIQAAAIGHTLVHGGQVQRGLIITPASLKSQWQREWQRATDVPITMVEGGSTQRADTYSRTDRGFLIANYEAVLRDLDIIRKWQPDFIILDEAQRIKNWSTQSAQAIKSLDSTYRLALTGTPMENRLDELASLMDWIDPIALAPKWRLPSVHQVCRDGSREVIGVKNLATIRQRLAKTFLRRKRSEILRELPSRTDTRCSVEMTPRQLGAHNELAQPIAALLAAASHRPLLRAEFLRLMSLLTTQRIIANGMGQLCFDEYWPLISSRAPDKAALEMLAMPKLAVLREIVGSLVVDQSRKVVIFSQWRRMIMLAQWAVADILAAAGKRSACFTGAESQRRRTQNVIEFHDDPQCAVLFCTDAGGVGLNLQHAANACINMELPWNPAVLEQRIARIHRMGQSDPIDVHNLVSEMSIESRIATTLSTKQALFSGLFDGQSDEIIFENNAGFVGVLKQIFKQEVDDEDDDVEVTHANPEDAPFEEMPPDLDEENQNLEPSPSATSTLIAAAPDGSDEIDADENPPTPHNSSGVVFSENEVASESVGTDDLDDERHTVDGRQAALDLVDDAQPRLSSPAILWSELMRDISIETQPDGRMRIDANPRAAMALAELFGGLAEMLRRSAATK
jgi:hypothetical protein